MTAKAPTTLTSFRWPDELAADARLVARVDGVSVNALICKAISDHVANRRTDCNFRNQLRLRIESDQRLLDALEGGE